MTAFRPAVPLSVLALALLLAACQQDAPPPAKPEPAPPQAAEVTPSPATELKDLIENDPRYIIGISYPPAASRYPGLAVELRAYADRARADVLKAADGLQPKPGDAPLELSLRFQMLVENAEIVAVAADGNSFTGGAHSMPLIERFVWLPKQNRRLRSAELIADPAGWSAVSDYVREQLNAAMSQRIDADELDPGERARLMQQLSRDIELGTAPSAESFHAFEPVVSPRDGKVSALRFVFPPYAVGPYVDGTRQVEVPAAMLLPYVAPAYRGLFTTLAPLPPPAAAAGGEAQPLELAPLQRP